MSTKRLREAAKVADELTSDGQHIYDLMVSCDLILAEVNPLFPAAEENIDG